MRANSIVLLVLLAACSSRPLSRVPFDANAEEISQLNGRWVGDYSSAGNGGSGSIVFDLTGDQKTAHGDVVMYSSIVNVPADIHHAAGVLAISFVRATDDVVTGKTLNTTFTGRMAGDTIEGTFESLSSDSNVPQRGRWKVKRISGATP